MDKTLSRLSNIKTIYQMINKKLINVDFDSINNILRSVKIDDIYPVEMIGYLRITFTAKDKLDYWKCFRDEVKTNLKSRKGLNVEKIMTGLL